MTFIDTIATLTWYQRITILRIVKGFTQIEMSSALNVAVDTYRSWEDGSHKPNRLGRKILAAYHELPENEIFGDMREV